MLDCLVQSCRNKRAALRLMRKLIRKYRMIPAKMEICWVISTVAKLTPKIRPRYLLRSPVSILRAIQFMVRPRYFRLCLTRRREAAPLPVAILRIGSSRPSAARLNWVMCSVRSVAS